MRTIEVTSVPEFRTTTRTRAASRPESAADGAGTPSRLLTALRWRRHEGATGLERVDARDRPRREHPCPFC